MSSTDILNEGLYVNQNLQSRGGGCVSSTDILNEGLYVNLNLQSFGTRL